MVNTMYLDDYKRWAKTELEDADLTAELESIAGNDEEIKERFAVSLKFGTAGLRGVLGVGSNRMNIYVVRQATQGLANWVKTQGGNQLVAISYDSRARKSARRARFPWWEENPISTRTNVLNAENVSQPVRMTL